MGLRLRLFVLTALACAPLVALMLHTAGEERRHQVGSWQNRAQKMRQIAQREEDKAVAATRQLLMALAESSAIQTHNRRSTKKLLDELFASYPRYANLGVVNTNGEVMASVLPLPEPSSQTNQCFFQRALQTQSFAVGEFPPAQVLSRPSVDFGYPVLSPAGDVIAVVFASLDLRWFDRFSSDLIAQLPKGATWTEVTTNGIILARHPLHKSDGWIGRPLPESAVLKSILEHPAGVLETSKDTGTDSFYAYSAMNSPLAGGSVVTLLGVPKQALFSQADRTLSRNLTWLGIAAGLAFVLGWFGSNLLIVRPVKTLVQAATRLAQGDLSVRTGLPHSGDELGQLTRAFDDMAEAMEQREADRQHTLQKLHVLSLRMVEVQESERRHIARELHDEIGQTLTSAEMNLQAALRAPSGPGIEQRLEDSIQAVERVLEQVHDISLNLRPSMLDDLGLEAALRWFTQRQASLAGLRAEFRAEPIEERMDPLIETGCFRVAQEALNNVVRHAQAHAVAVELSRHDNRLHLRVRDDGVGFDVAALRDRAMRGASLGLLSMEERAALAGGGIEYQSHSGRGTEIHAWFPLKWKNAPVLAEVVA